MTAPKHETHDAKKNNKPASQAGGEEKFIDSLGQENPAMEMEKKMIAEKEEQRQKAEQTATKEEKKS